MNKKFRVGIISGKLGDVDGVSLEVDKWITVLKKQGHQVYTIAGKYTNPLPLIPEDRQILLEDIAFGTEEQRFYELNFFPHISSKISHIPQSRLNKMKEDLTERGMYTAQLLYGIISKHNIDVIIGENTNAMPMALLAALGIYYLCTKWEMATIFHHHDFWWERSRFSDTLIEPLLHEIMPPANLGTEHVVISSYAEHILSSFKHIKPHIIYNYEDFDHPPVADEYNKTFRKELGFKKDDLLFVQPTRIVPRKRIEDSIRLVSLFMKKYPKMAPKVHFLISLYQGDELGNGYVDSIKTLAKKQGVRLHLISDRVSSMRGTDNEGRKIFSNRDVLVNSDIITYLPVWEGFGNALLEALAAKVPVVTTTYLVYKTDIRGSGFNNIEVRDIYDENQDLTFDDSTLEKIYTTLTNPRSAKKWLNITS